MDCADPTAPPPTRCRRTGRVPGDSTFRHWIDSDFPVDTWEKNAHLWLTRARYDHRGRHMPVPDVWPPWSCESERASERASVAQGQRMLGQLSFATRQREQLQTPLPTEIWPVEPAGGFPVWSKAVPFPSRPQSGPRVQHETKSPAPPHYSAAPNERFSPNAPRPSQLLAVVTHAWQRRLP